MLKTLRRIIQEVAGTSDFKEALNIMVKRVAKALDTQACSIFLLDRARGEYVLMATKGLNQRAVGKLRIPVNQGLVGLVGEREEPINLDDAKQHPRFLSVPEAEEEKYKAFLGTPIVYHRQVLGVLIVQQQKPRRYDEAEEAFLSTLGAQLAAIVAHAEATHMISQLFEGKSHLKKEETYSGIPSSAGIGIGIGVVVYPSLELDAIPDRLVEDVEAEVHLLDTAIKASKEDFRILGEKLYPNLSLEERDLFDGYQRLLDISDMGAEIVHAIREGNWAPGALRQVIQAHVQHLENLENEYLRERAIDIKDLGNRI